MVRPDPCRSSAIVWRMSFTIVSSGPPSTTEGSSDRTMSAESAVGRQQPAVDDVVVQRPLDKLMVGRALRQGLAKDGLRQPAAWRGLASGKHGKSAARSLDKSPVRTIMTSYDRTIGCLSQWSSRAPPRLTSKM